MRLNRDKIVSKIPRNKESIWEIRTASVDKLGTPADIVFLGDSTVKSAIHDETFSKVTGLQTLNLGLTGDLGTYGDYRMLEYYLAKTKTSPKYVVFWHTLDVWPRNLEDFIFNFTNPSLSELKDHFTNNFAKNPLKFAPVIIENGLVNTLYIYRYKIVFRDWYLQLFHQTLSATPSAPKIVWTLKKASPSKDNIFWLGKLSTLCKDKGIHLVAMESPVLKDYYNLTDAQIFIQNQDAILTSEYEKLNITFIRERYVFSQIETVDFNLDHVNETGALKASGFYAQKLRTQIR